jgi:hypothetical protein
MSLSILITDLEGDISRWAASHKTVRNCVYNIFSKLQVADRSQAIVKAREAGLDKIERQAKSE